MPEIIRLYLDQMLQVHVADVLRQKGHDVLRVSETGQSRADDRQVLQQAIRESRILVPFLIHISSEEIKNHLVILSTSREKWIRTI